MAPEGRQRLGPLRKSLSAARRRPFPARPGPVSARPDPVDLAAERSRVQVAVGVLAEARERAHGHPERPDTARPAGAELGVVELALAVVAVHVAAVDALQRRVAR